ncbi:scavenger receptor cysteine-rich domain superfamily protein-like [Mercenaria mercenaria]|uniref:scavenger receptor cysteine-rich domain superfamily protein-like n=1 Tax=Mercenaria mercenaria TaxID=6596 RepID=UPI00234EFCBA|nr:scavenger receptor cysteine-rich domain superfamily protein-like [Mercenaria mercenaria]
MMSFVKFYAFPICVLYCLDAVLTSTDDIGVKVRLAGGTSNGTGRLEVFFNGQWSTVYSRSFDQNDAEVVCTMLGYQNRGLVSVFKNVFGAGSGPIISTDFNCLGTESSLVNCSQPNSWQVHTDWRHSSDTEMGCEATPIRLVDGDSPQSGRVELFISNKWYTVCDNDFDDNDASVICRMLGFSDSGISRAFSKNHYGQGYGGVIVTQLECDGTERDIKQCKAEWGTNSCDHTDDAGVNCGRTEIRLVDGVTNTSGRVEVLHGGKWGTICSHGGFSNQDVQVICKMIGIQNPNAFGYSNAYYGEGTVHMLLSRLACDGSESDITQCSSTEWAGPSDTRLESDFMYCSHSNDVGVNCEGKTKIRLVDGVSAQSGRVEIFHLGQWGTVSNKYFDFHELKVICRMLGFNYSSKSFIKDNAYYGQGVGRVLVSEMQCNGDESDIGQCSATWWPMTDSLKHDADVGISCDGYIPTKLVGGSDNASGRVEIFHNGYYHTICAGDFTRRDLIVVCRMLGFENIPRSAYWRYVSTFEQGIGTPGASYLKCDGTETSIAQCDGHMPGVVDSYYYKCDHAKDLFVSCNGASEKIRLVGGHSNNSGIVEINISGIWGTVCDNGFDRLDAVVICRMLKFPRPERAITYTDAHRGHVNGPIHMKDLKCNGVETSIGQCNPEMDTRGCQHSKDAGVDCCPHCEISGQLVG